MSIIAIVDFRIRPERREQALAVFESVLAQTRVFPGAEGIEWLQDRDEPERWTLYERWESPEHELAYRAYRAGEGAVPELGEVLAGPPALWRFDPVDGSPA